jgi:hypothetical protein
VPRFGKSTLHVTLQMNLSAPDDSMHGMVTDGVWSAEVLANRQVYVATSNQATKWAGKYTLLLPPDTNGPTDLRGYGYAVGAVSTGGKLQLIGGLADGTAINTTVTVSKDGKCPVYVSLYPGIARLTNGAVVANKPEFKGFLLGWLSVSNATNEIMTGDLNWVKKPWTNLYWANGFTNRLSAVGSSFHTPTIGTRVMSFTNFAATFSQSVLTSDIVAPMQLKPNNLITSNGSNPISLALQFNTANGQITGHFVDSTAGSCTVKGALLQQQNYGGGFFTGKKKPGAFQLWAQ